MTGYLGPIKRMVYALSALLFFALLCGTAQGAEPAALYRNSYALLIGVNEYPKIPKDKWLQYAVDDVVSLQKLLVKSYGFRKENVKVLTDANATRAKIEEALSDLADSDTIKNDDRVLIFFSGHGQTVKAPGGDMGFLLPYDASVKLTDMANAGPFMRTCLPMSRVWEYLQPCPAKHVLILADVCYSGLLAQSRAVEDINTSSIEVLAKTPARQVMTAGGKGQKSVEKSQWGHGAFTYKLLEKLTARTAEPGKVFTAQDLFAEVRTGVGNITDGKQTPQLYSKDTEGEFLFTPNGDIEAVAPEIKPEIPPEDAKVEQVSTLAAIKITSNPAGASVWIDDVQTEGQTTPCEVAIDLGAAKSRKVEIALKLAGCKDAVYNITALRGKSVALEGKLAAKPVITPAIATPIKTETPETTLGSIAPGTKKYDVCNNPKDGAEMVWVPEGEFVMGSDSVADAKPQRKVYLDGYWMYKYEVTVAQYKKFCSESGKKMVTAPSWGWIDSHPMVNVNWNDAVDYAKWAGGSLPTEAQWEKAARGTDGREYPWGNQWDASKCNNDGNKTQAVGSYPAGASPYGCMDMAGNVWEWCSDWYGDNYYKSAPSRNPSGPSNGSNRVLRGGGLVNLNYYSRCASRDYYSDPYDVYFSYGFRLAR